MLTWLGYIDGKCYHIYHTWTLFLCFVLWEILTMNWNRKGSSRVAATRISNGQLRDVNRRQTTSLQRERRHRTRRTWFVTASFQVRPGLGGQDMTRCCSYAVHLDKFEDEAFHITIFIHVYPCFIHIFIHILIHICNVLQAWFKYVSARKSRSRIANWELLEARQSWCRRSIHTAAKNRSER